MNDCNTVSTSLVEATVVLSLVYRPDHSKLPEDEQRTWAQAQSAIGQRIIDYIVETVQSAKFDGVDSPILVEDLTGRYREVRLHVGLNRCAHTE